MSLKSSVKNKSLFSILSIVLLLLAGCSKDAVLPEAENKDTRTNEYEIESLDYFLAEEDEIDTVKVEFTPIEFNNPSPELMEYQHIEEFDNLFKTSAFQLDTVGKGLPSDLNFSQFEVNVPAAYYKDGTFSYYPQRFPMSDSLQKETYKYSTSTLDLKIPAHTKFILTGSIDQHDMTCSFKAVIRNKTTGETYTVTGKWEGVLRYFNSFLRIDEAALD